MNDTHLAAQVRRKIDAATIGKRTDGLDSGADRVNQ